jgi:hypothetical protein
MMLVRGRDRHLVNDALRQALREDEEVVVVVVKTGHRKDVYRGESPVTGRAK